MSKMYEVDSNEDESAIRLIFDHDHWDDPSQIVDCLGLTEEAKQAALEVLQQRKADAASRLQSYRETRDRRREVRKLLQENSRVCLRQCQSDPEQAVTAISTHMERHNESAWIAALRTEVKILQRDLDCASRRLAKALHRDQQATEQEACQ